MNYEDATALSIFFFAIALFIAYFFVSGFIWGAGYEPTDAKNIDAAAELLDINQDKLVYDLGSGTGDVVIRLAKKYKARCVGIEIDPLKVWISRYRISKDRDARNLVMIERKNFLNADISNADAVYIFLSGGTDIMRKLGAKLNKELKEGTKVASFVHSFPDIEAESQLDEIRIYSLRKRNMN